MTMDLGHFFDDYPAFSLKMLESNMEACSKRMKALGLVFDLSEYANGFFRIERIPERRAELLATLNDVLDENSLSLKEAERLRGRLHSYDCYLFGRSSNLAIHRRGKLATATNGGPAPDDELKSSLTFVHDKIHSSLPLELSAKTQEALLVSLRERSKNTGPLWFSGRHCF